MTWERKLILDALCLAPAHEWHDLDTAHSDPPPPPRQPVPVVCLSCGETIGEALEPSRRRLILQRHGRVCER